MDYLGVWLQYHLFTLVRMYWVPWGTFSLMVVSLVFVNDSHHWPVIKRFPPCLTPTPLFTWLGFVPFVRFGLKTLDWQYNCHIFLLPKLQNTFSHFIWHLLRHRSTLYSCGYDRLLSMNPPCSFVAMTPLDFMWCLFAYCATMIVKSIIHMLDPPLIFMAIICIWTCMS